MAGPIVIGASSAAALLKTTYDADFGLEPTEESVAADWVSKPVGMTAIGNTLTLRKVKAFTATKHTGALAGLPSNLTSAGNQEEAVTTTLSYAYVMVEIDEPVLTRLVDDGPYRNAIRKQIAAAVNSQVDADILALAASLSHTESVADLDDATYRSAVGQLSTYAKNKFRLGKTPIKLFIHPSEVENALGIDAAKSYLIRGNQGTAPSGQLVTTYGINFEESGNVYSNLGNYYNALTTKEAWAVGYNITPSSLPDQPDGVVTRMIFRAEYGVAEWFDSCGVAIITT